MRKKVSCHIITYNQKNFISQCIDGVLMQQTNFPFELIIGDDNSTDGTREILIEYQKKHPELITLNLRTVRGNGIPGKENFVSTLKKCHGEYISFCDGDDYWTDPLKLQKQVDFLENSPDYVLCFHPIKILNSDGNIVEDFITKVPESHETIEDLARFGNYIHTPTVVFRNLIRFLPYEFQLSPIGDYFIYMILVEHGKLKYMQDTMAVYRHGVGILSGNDNVLKLKKWIECLILIFSNCKNEEIKSILYERYQNGIDAIYRLTLKKDKESYYAVFKKKLMSLKNKIYKKNQ